ncbi:hypothetical protein AAG607_00610 [Citromicrobium bathyomarinum]|mgnify:FL=1|uniref:hypothetical protein n=1 Tax=Sphingomonadales TaxID=204457 RepID=UPI00315AC8B9|tara:strand:+ start:4960 stop:5487 length:528 start_codon:yes stop_codon:yes gene_type:complete
MRQFVLAGCVPLLALAACVPRDPTPEILPPAPLPPAPAAANPGAPAISHGAPTRVLSEVDAERLRHTSGITLQWIGWDERGPLEVTVDEEGVWQLSGSQTGEDGGELLVRGRIVEIGEGYFTLRGLVSIEDAPDAGRSCRQDKMWHFAITQNRRYYRLREFEWCDYLTDYVDIYY